MSYPVCGSGVRVQVPYDGLFIAASDRQANDALSHPGPAGVTPRGLVPAGRYVPAARGVPVLPDGLTSADQLAPQCRFTGSARKINSHLDFVLFYGTSPATPEVCTHDKQPSSNYVTTLYFDSPQRKRIKPDLLSFIREL